MSESVLLTPEDRADVQGLVTSGYGHLPRYACLFLRITEPIRARAWLADLAKVVGSATSWRPRPGESKKKPAEAVHVAMTFEGLEALGLSREALGTFPEPFREGMTAPRRAERILGDIGESAPDRWRIGGPHNPFHVLLLLYAGDDGFEPLVVRHRQWARSGLEEVAFEKGLHTESGHGHFGFRDGIAQPPIRGIHGKGVADGEFLLGHLGEDGFYPPSLLVPEAEDPGGHLQPYGDPRVVGRRDLGRNGTYLVYRRLRQDVFGFWRFMLEESERIEAPRVPDRAAWLAARMVGRWPGGAPLALSPDHDDPALADADDFGYFDDPRGLRCPVGSHVRRANPRDHLRSASSATARRLVASRRLIRRGRLFGPPLFSSESLTGPDIVAALTACAADSQDVERGLHFLAINTDIGGQFEVVQQQWCNNPGFNGLLENRDPLIAPKDPTEKFASRMRIPGCPWRQRSAPLPRFVTATGGAYLFLPSLSALRFLAQLGTP